MAGAPQDDLDYLKVQAEVYAGAYNQKAVTPEILLLTLLYEGGQGVLDFLDSCNVDAEDLKNSLIDGFGDGEEDDKAQQFTVVRLNHESQKIFKELNDFGTELKFKNSKYKIGPVDLLANILRTDNAASLLIRKKFGMDVNDVTEKYREHIKEDVKRKAAGPAQSTALQKIDTSASGETKPNRELPPGIIKLKEGGMLDRFCRNLNLAAVKGELDPAIARDGEIMRTMQILGRRKKNNPVLTGEAGVGKTAVVEGLATLIAKGEVPERMKGKNIFSLDVNALVAGTKFRGEFEERVQKLLKEIKKHKDAVLFIDEAHMISGAGSASEGPDLANAIKPALSEGSMHCIMATTIKEFRAIEKDAALARRVQEVRIDPPDAAATLQMIKNQKAKYETHHGVKITDAAIEAAVDHSDRNLTGRMFPDKAFDVVDEAMAAAGLDPKAPPVVDVADIEAVISKMTNRPVAYIRSRGADVLRTLEDDLNKKVVNNPEPARLVTAAIKRQKAGLKEPHQPIANFMFLGGTGTGKTEFAKALANHMSMDFIRLDMSEYQEKHTVSRLNGAPPGYVGYEEGGQLTEAVRKKPHAVILLDEIDKAHHDVFDVLLQVLDDGRLTDSSGRTVEFKNTIVIMTGNIRQMQVRNTIGLKGQEEPVEKRGLHRDSPELKLYFRPEFLNRVDEVVSFNDHNHLSMVSLVGLFTAALEKKLASAGVSLDLDDGARGYLADKGFDPKLGARPLKRLIQNEVGDPIADRIIDGDLKDGGIAKVRLGESGKLSLTFTAKAKPQDTAKEEQGVKLLPSPQSSAETPPPVTPN